MPKRSARKERFWRRMLRRQKKSGLRVRQFCLQHQLSEPSLYGWKRPNGSCRFYAHGVAG